MDLIVVEDSLLKDFGAELKRLRKKLRWTQTVMATHAGVSADNIVSRWENGRAQPANLVGLLKVLTDFLPREELTELERLWQRLQGLSPPRDIKIGPEKPQAYGESPNPSQGRRFPGIQQVPLEPRPSLAGLVPTVIYVPTEEALTDQAWLEALAVDFTPNRDLEMHLGSLVSRFASRAFRWWDSLPTLAEERPPYPTFQTSCKCGAGDVCSDSAAAKAHALTFREAKDEEYTARPGPELDPTKSREWLEERSGTLIVHGPRETRNHYLEGHAAGVEFLMRALAYHEGRVEEAVEERELAIRLHRDAVVTLREKDLLRKRVFMEDILLASWLGPRFYASASMHRTWALGFLNGLLLLFELARIYKVFPTRGDVFDLFVALEGAVGGKTPCGTPAFTGV